MSFIWDFLGEVLWHAIAAFVFTTGEILRWMWSLGSRRVRWFDYGDFNLNKLSIMLGAAFWLGLGAIVVWIFS